MKKIFYWIAGAFVYSIIATFSAFILLWLIFGSMERNKERLKLDPIHQYRISKTMENLQGRENLP